MSFFFPLYEDLKTKITNYSLTESQQNNLLELLKTNKEDENVYLFMRSFEQDTNGNMNMNLLPYEGRQLKTSIRFDFDKIPMKLKAILLHYFSIKNKKDT